MSKWVLGIAFLVGSHFSISYLVPLDEEAQTTLWGLLRWAWPWAYGDRGLFGTLSPQPSGFPIAGFFIAVTSGTLLCLAAFAVLHWWVPSGWWRPLAIAGAVLQLALMASFLALTKIMPMALDVSSYTLRWSHDTA